MNKVLLIGNLGRNPEIKATKTGRQMAHFSLATSREFVNPKTGERKEITDWVNITAWGNLAETCKYMAQGQRVFVAGRISTRSYEPGDGTKRYITDVTAEFIAPAQSMKTGTGNFSQFGPSAPKPQPMEQQSMNFGNAKDEDIPF